MLGLVIFLTLVLLFIRSPWGQDIIVNRVISYVSGITGTKVSIDRLYITFAGNISLEGLYLEDQQQDTLIYSHELEVSVALLPLIRGDEVNIKSVDWNGLKTHIYQPDSKEFNYEFLITAFAGTPDTTSVVTEPSPSLQISIGDINLNDFQIRFEDASRGMKSQVKLGQLHLDINTLDLERMHFDIDALEVAHTRIDYAQTASVTATEPISTGGNTDSSTLPQLSIGKLTLNEVILNYDSEPDQIKARASIGDFFLSLPEANLDQQIIALENLSLNNSDISVWQRSEVQTQLITAPDSVRSPVTFEWPAWQVEAETIAMSNNKFVLDTSDTVPLQGVFDPNQLTLTNLDLLINDVSVKPNDAGFRLKNLSLKERSGLNLESFTFDFQLSDKNTSVSKVHLASTQNSLQGQVELNYNSLNDLINHPELSYVSMDLTQFKIGLSEAFIFSPELANSSYVNLLAQKPLTGLVNLKGTLGQLSIPQTMLKWGEHTKIDFNGSIRNLMDPDNMRVDFPQLRAQTRRSDLIKIISENEAGVLFPQSINLTGSLKGGMTDVSTNLKLKTSDGTISLKGKFANTTSPTFSADVTVEDIKLSKLLKNESLDTLSFKASIAGEGASLNNLNLKLQSDFSHLKYDGYDFSGISLAGDIKQGAGNLDVLFKDQNLDMSFKTLMQLDSVSPSFKTTLTVAGADLYELGLTTESIRTAFVFNADFTGNAEVFELKSSLNDGVAVYQRKAYGFGSFNLSARGMADSLNLQASSSILDANVTANKSVANLIPILQGQFERYFTSAELNADSITDPAKISVKMAVRQAPILTDVFLQDLERLDTVLINVDFDEQTQLLAAKLTAPYILYQGSRLDSLQIALNGAKDIFNFHAGWAGVNSGPLSIDKTALTGSIENNLISSNLTVFDSLQRLVHLSSRAEISNDTIQFHIVPDDLVFNKKPWTVSADNQLIMAANYIDINSFDLSNGDQKVTLGTQLPGQQQVHVGAIFENFHLATITNLLNADEPVAKGILGGDFVIENPFGNYGLLAELGINDLSVLEAPLGNLTLKAQSNSEENYKLDLILKGENADLELVGGYRATGAGPELTLDLLLNKLQMTLLEHFSDGAISESAGTIAGKVEVSGTTSNPKYTGTLDFENVSMFVNQLKSEFSFNNEQLRVDNSGLYLDKFVITDGEKNDFSLDGKILTKELSNPTFDLKLKADNFRLLNSTKEDSELFYGKVNMDADMRIQGDLTIPKVRGSLKINDASDLTLVVPESQLEVKSRDGVVLFVNRKNPDDILTRVKQNEVSGLAATLSGYDVETVLSVGKDAVFKIIIDEATGDNLQVSGTGDFSLGLEPNGLTSLSGKYELSGGHYETNLYNLVKRKFSISPGSTITWGGDPYDAELAVSAIYSVKTSAAPLMAVRTSGQSDDASSIYQEKLPFDVFINVKGVLLKPEISFNLEMPEDDRGAIGGEVYAQVQQLNSQEEELNKQVFSLLVLNRFFPGAGSDGSSGGPASLALDNVNKVLSGQLNNYSDKLFGKSGLELGFDLNSTSGSQGGATQTQLGISAKKRLFNDRLIVQVGSEVDVAGNQNSSEGAPIIGNVSVEYLLTEDKRLRLQGFNKNVYEGVIDGQLTVSGIALIFSREFNKFKELWTRQVKEATNQNREVKEDK